MILRKFECDVKPVDTPDYVGLTRAEIWVEDVEDNDAIINDLRDLAGEFGYDVVNGGIINATDEYEDCDLAYRDDLFSILNDW